MAAQFSASMATMADRISQLEDFLQILATPTPAVTHTLAENIPVNTDYHLKARLSDPERFDGSDTSLFPQFAGLLEAKLEIDAACIGNEREKVWYAFGHLTGTTAARIYP